MPPIKPLAAYEGACADIIVDMETRPEPALELTRDGVTVRVQYWPKVDLDRKFTRGGETSAFHFEPTWAQSSRVDVWHVSVGRPLLAKLGLAEGARREYFYDGLVERTPERVRALSSEIPAVFERVGKSDAPVEYNVTTQPWARLA